MRSRTIVMLAVLLPLATLPAQKKKAAAAATASSELLRLEDLWASALVKRDGAAFRKMLARGFVYTEDDQMVGRDDVLTGILSGADTVTAAHNEGMQVHQFGNTGVVTGWLVTSGRGKRGPFNRRYRFTDTWVHHKDGWQIVAAQDYLKP
jgi:ketosteroid isomerase-like protein